MEINEYEYKYLKDIESRYNALCTGALQFASLYDGHPGELYIRGTGLREELKKYRAHDYAKRVHELKAEQINKGGYGKYGY
jgi:hypothetical protein